MDLARLWEIIIIKLQEYMLQTTETKLAMQNNHMGNSGSRFAILKY